MRIALEEFTASDIPLMLSWVRDERLLLQFAGPAYSFPLTTEQIEADMREAAHNAEGLFFRAVHLASGKTIGHIQLRRIDSENRSCRIARVLLGDQGFRRQGLGEEMVRRAVETAFGALGMRRVSLSVFEHNTPALACYRRIGFQEEERETFEVPRTGEEWLLIRMSLDREPYGPKTGAA